MLNTSLNDLFRPVPYYPVDASRERNYQLALPGVAAEQVKVQMRDGILGITVSPKDVETVEIPTEK